MLRQLRVLLMGWVAVHMAVVSSGFTLHGPNTAWQTDTLGYNINSTIPGLGPVNLGEEYRWNTPTIYYAFSSDFLNYFGDYGAKEVDKAMQMLNNLPAMAEVKLDDFPLGSLRINHRAQALGLTDLRSFALATMLYELGISDPTRYVFCIRNRWIPTGCPPGPILYHIINRNFDPVTLQHSPYINGDLWTYTTILDSCTGPAFLPAEPVDPLALLGYRRSPVTSVQSGLLYGGYWTGLTRDDVGCLRYLYRKENYNVETIPPGVLGGTNFAGTSGGSPWGIPPWLLTNGFATNIATGTNAFVDPGLRGGIDKISWQRLDYDSIMGNFFTPVTNIYTEEVVLNGRTIEQGIQRVVAVPDIIFDAADLQGPDTQDTIVSVGYVQTAWQDNDGINGVAGQAGPGTVVPSVGTTPAMIVTLSSVGPLWGNSWPGFLSQADADQPNTFFLWGSFDGSTNAPVVYPIGTSIEAIEAQVLGGD